MTEKIPAVLGSPLYDPARKFVPGSSTDYSCKICHRRLVVSPSSLRHMARLGEAYDFWLFCPWCADQLAQLWAKSGGEPMRVMQTPGSDEEMRTAGLDADADETAAEADRLRRLFGG